MKYVSLVYKVKNVWDHTEKVIFQNKNELYQTCLGSKKQIVVFSQIKPKSQEYFDVTSKRT